MVGLTRSRLASPGPSLGSMLLPSHLVGTARCAVRARARGTPLHAALQSDYPRFPNAARVRAARRPCREETLPPRLAAKCPRGKQMGFEKLLNALKFLAQVRSQLRRVRQAAFGAPPFELAEEGQNDRHAAS